MKNILFLFITTIALLLSSVGYGQTLELGLLSSFEAYTGAGAVTNEGQMSGDAGTHNGIISGTGFGPGYAGTTYPSGSPTSYQARIDLLRVYIHLSDVFVTFPGTHAPVFGATGAGETIYPGVYSIPGAGSVGNKLILDGLGNPDAVFIIKYEGAFTIGTSSTIVLSNGTRAANVFWISEGAIQVGANSVIKGNLISHPGAISLGTNCTIEGRIFASEGAITIGAGSVATTPAGPITIPINCLGTCVSNPVVDVLGSLSSFALFTSAGAVANAATSGFIGDIGTHAGAISGFETSTHALGEFYTPGPVTAQAVQDLDNAYNQLMAIQNTQLGHLAAFGGGETMQPGVYYIAGAGSLAGTIVLDANNDPDAIFVFKFLGAFSVAAQSKVILRNGARRCNVFWISGAGGTGAIDVGTFAFMKGTLLAHGGACTAAANVNLEGRMLSTAGAIGFSTGVIYNDTLCFEDEIALVKTGLLVDANASQCPEVGETIDYTFTVTNQGNESLSTIVLTDPLVPIITFVSGDTDGDMALDTTETWTYTGTYTINQDDINENKVINQAFLQATTYNGFLINDLSGATINDDDPTETIILCQKIALVKTGLFIDTNTDQCTDLGETIDYTFTVTNEGDGILSAIAVTDVLVPIITFVSGDTDGDMELDIAETWIYTGTYTVDQDDIDLGQVSNIASVQGTGLDASVVTDMSGATITDDTPTLIILCQDAKIALLKEADVVLDPATNCYVVGVDGTIEYSFSVTNTGNVTLANVVITDPGVTIFGGPIASLAPGVTDATTYTASYVITQQDIAAGLYSNQATATGTSSVGVDVTDLSGTSIANDTPTVTTLCNTPSIALVKVGVYDGLNGAGDCVSTSGDTILYSFSVTNTGNVLLSNVVITDPGVTILGGPIASLAPGVTDATTYTASYVITQQDIDAGLYSNQATATGTSPVGVDVTDLSGTSITNDTPTVTILCQNDSIALIKTAVFNDANGNDCADVNETITYSFRVVNTGNTVITNIDIDDALVNVQGGPISLNPGQEDTTTFTAIYLITQVDINTGSITNTATVTGLNPDGVVVSDLSDDNSFLQDDPTITDLCQNDSIALIKTGFFNDANGNNCADVNETITYSFRVVNTGNTAITNINIDDALVNVQGGPILLNPGQEDTTTFTATYLITQVDINIGSVTNTAIVAGLNPDGVVVSDISDNDTLTEDDPTVTLLCNNAVIALIKTGVPGDENGNGCVDLGETIVYDFVVTNLGNVTLTQVIVTDPMVVVQGGSVTLLPGVSDTETFSAVYTVTQDDVEAGLVSNQAIAEGLDPSGNVVNDLSDDNSNFENDSTTTILCQDPSIFVEKAGVFNDENGNFIPEPGETISYVFVVTNTGNLSVFNITLEDPLPGIVISGGPITSLAPGEIDATTFTASYAITSADIEAGEVINQAVVRGITAGGEDLSDTSDDPNDPTDTDPDGDGDPDDPTITILPNVLTAVFEIFNAVSADGNGENDFFFINGISEYPDNNVQIFNRWGVKVYQTNGYGGSNDTENVFTGYSEGRQTVSPGALLPTGTYYYIITFNGPDNPGLNSYAGYLYLNR